jgi:hypothetical protein
MTPGLRRLSSAQRARERSGGVGEDAKVLGGIVHPPSRPLEPEDRG